MAFFRRTEHDDQLTLREEAEQDLVDARSEEAKMLARELAPKLKEFASILEELGSRSRVPVAQRSK